MVEERRVDDLWLLAWMLTDKPILVRYEARLFQLGFYHKPLPGTTTWPVRLRKCEQLSFRPPAIPGGEN